MNHFFVARFFDPATGEIITTQQQVVEVNYSGGFSEKADGITLVANYNATVQQHVSVLEDAGNSITGLFMFKVNGQLVWNSLRFIGPHPAIAGCAAVSHTHNDLAAAIAGKMAADADAGDIPYSSSASYLAGSIGYKVKWLEGMVAVADVVGTQPPADSLDIEVVSGATLFTNNVQVNFDCSYEPAISGLYYYHFEYGLTAATDEAGNPINVAPSKTTSLMPSLDGQAHALIPLRNWGVNSISGSPIPTKLWARCVIRNMPGQSGSHSAFISACVGTFSGAYSTEQIDLLSSLIASRLEVNDNQVVSKWTS